MRQAGAPAQAPTVGTADYVRRGRRLLGRRLYAAFRLRPSARYFPMSLDRGRPSGSTSYIATRSFPRQHEPPGPAFPSRNRVFPDPRGGRAAQVFFGPEEPTLSFFSLPRPRLSAGLLSFPNGRGPNPGPSFSGWSDPGAFFDPEPPTRFPLLPQLSSHPVAGTDKRFMEAQLPQDTPFSPRIRPVSYDVSFQGGRIIALPIFPGNPKHVVMATFFPTSLPFWSTRGWPSSFFLPDSGRDMEIPFQAFFFLWTTQRASLGHPAGVP